MAYRYQARHESRKPRDIARLAIAALCLLAAACAGSKRGEEPPEPPAALSGDAVAARADSGASGWRPNPYGIDADYGLSVVRELSKGEYEGRQAGTRGGKAARAWIAAELRGLGLSVREQAFTEVSATLEGEAALELRGLFGSDRAYAFRREFRDVVRGAYRGGVAEGPLKLITEPGQSFASGDILLLPSGCYEPDDLGRWEKAAGLVLELGGGSSVGVRPLFAGQAPGRKAEPRDGLVVLGLDRALFAEAAAAYRALATGTPSAGPRARVASPARFAEREAANIYAEWNGDGGDCRPAYLLSAHYDHVGLDLDGTPFPGALDNASGVATLLALARTLSSDEAPVDLAFLFTDAEESGLSGAQAFARAPLLHARGVRLINLDMVASAAKLAVGVLYSGDEASRPLAESLASALRAAGFRAGAESPYTNMDHYPLTFLGMAAVSLTEYDTAAYHRTSDTAEGISPAELDALGDCLYRYVTERR